MLAVSFRNRANEQGLFKVDICSSCLNLLYGIFVQHFFFIVYVLQAFLIAFTSTFLPKLLYRFAVSPDNSLNGYLNFSLAWAPPNTTSTPCR